VTILETRDLCHDFDGLRVLSHVDLGVRRGERHAIIGPNGAGKTTLFNIVTGTYTPRSGRVFFRGEDVTGASPYALVRLGVGRSFQITSTFARLSTFENVRMGILGRRGIRFNLLRRVDAMPDVTREAEEVLRRINLSAERDLPARLLSYGKHRALEISLAMTTEPELVLLDEPTAGMSRDETQTAVELIRRLTEGRTVVIIEHDMDVVFSLADRITVLHHGEILATGAPDEIKANRAVKDAYLGD
jgi:branched-chain amino acid transport system ATP-binding protein